MLRLALCIGNWILQDETKKELEHEVFFTLIQSFKGTELKLKGRLHLKTHTKRSDGIPKSSREPKEKHLKKICLCIGDTFTDDLRNILFWNIVSLLTMSHGIEYSKLTRKVHRASGSWVEYFLQIAVCCYNLRMENGLFFWTAFCYFQCFPLISKSEWQSQHRNKQTRETHFLFESPTWMHYTPSSSVQYKKQVRHHFYSLAHFQ